jgi:hypothetical protein
MFIFASLLKKYIIRMKSIRVLNILVVLIMFTNFSIQAQKFGLRAGLNYTKFKGPLEAEEKYSTTSGWHFGVNYAYSLSDVLALNGELLYTQTGTSYSYLGDSFYKIPLSSSNSLIPNAYLYEKGKTDLTMKISNAYITIPLTVQWDVSNKIELSAGVYGSVLIGPKGNGTIKFNSYRDDTRNPDSLFFQHSLIYNYNTDKAGQSTGQVGPWVFVNKDKTPIAKGAGAYYNYLSTELEGKLYKPYDYGLTGGISYFVNKGLFLGLRYDFGLVDITNNEVDVSRKTYDETNNRFKFSKDFDRNVGFQVSFGFRF